MALENADCAMFLTEHCVGHEHRKRLFNMINELPTVFDVVTGKKPVKEKPVVNNNAGSKPKAAVGKVVRHLLLWTHVSSVVAVCSFLQL
jgi:hypothetical protein